MLIVCSRPHTCIHVTVIKVQIYNLHSYLSHLAQKCTNSHLPQPCAAQEHPEISSHCFWGTVKWARPLNMDKLIDSEPFSLRWHPRSLVTGLKNWAFWKESKKFQKVAFLGN